MTPPRTRHLLPLACALAAAALAAGCLVAADVVPQRARAQDSSVQVGAATAEAAGAGGSWCARIPPGTRHPPINFTPVTLQLTQSSVEPVPATDGLIHLAYAAQVTNTQATPADIAGVVPVDPLAGFAPTGSNIITDTQGRSVAGQVKLFVTSPDDIPPDDGPEPVQPGSPFSTRVPAGNAGLMFFDVTYTDPAQIPRLLAHAITLASPDGGSGPGTPALTNPVPVGCKRLAVLRPPLVGHGWIAFSGCCTAAAYHRDVVAPVNGVLQAGQQFAIDYEQVGPNGTCCNGGSYKALNSWWGYGTPVLAAAPGVVVRATDGLPDQEPVGTITGVTLATLTGNSIVEDIGGGRYFTYAHLKPGSIPAWVRPGARLSAGDLIGRVGNSGNSSAPHLHFQVADAPDALDATGLPFVFGVQLLEGRVPEGVEAIFDTGGAVTIDRTGAGPRRGLMPARNGVFGYNLSSSQ